jgi:hypothetical protein
MNKGKLDHLRRAVMIILTIPLFATPALAGEILSDGISISPRIGLGVSWSSGSDDDWDREWEEEWDDDSRDGRSGERYGGYLTDFEYRDRDFRQVYLAGDFTDWELEPMELDRWGESWIISWALPAGTHSYQFTVEDSLGRWTAIDPENPEARKDGEYGWVSEIERHSRRRGHGRERERDDRDWSSVDRVMREFDLATDCDGSDDDCVVGYQRVDGLTITLRNEHLGQEDFEPSAHGVVGYGFKSEEWHFGLTVLQPLLPGNRLWLSLNGFIGTDFTDNTGIGGIENTLAALFFREDFRDYHWREGVSFSLVFGAYPWLRAEAGINSSDYSSLTNQTSWSLTDGRFDPNPAIDEGTLRSCYGNIRLGTEYNNFQLALETCGDNILGGSYSYDQVTAQMRGRIPVSSHQNVDFRLKGGSTLGGRLPSQKQFLMGGLGTVRGYRYQSLLVLDENRDPATPVYGGEMMLLGNFEYSLGSLIDLPGLVLFYDIGMAWEDRLAEIRLEDMKQSAGIGLQLDDDGLRVDLIRPLDSDNNDLVVQVRLNRSF